MPALESVIKTRLKVVVKDYRSLLLAFSIDNKPVLVNIRQPGESKCRHNGKKNLNYKEEEPTSVYNKEKNWMVKEQLILLTDQNMLVD